MKNFFFSLAFCFLVATTHAAEKIEGAFGLRFGEVFEPTAAPVAVQSRTDNFFGAYEFKPDKPNPAFSTYVVWVSPASHRIYKIAAVRTFADFDERERTAAKLVAALSNKYSDTPVLQGPVSQYHKSIEVNNFDAKDTAPYGLMVVYYDQDTGGKSAVEEAAIRLAEIARHQREVARTVDATGL